MTSRTLDFPLDIIWPRLIAIADEMATTLFRTAFSHDVVEVHDMSTGLYDERGNLIAQTWLGATGHTGVMPVFGKNLIRAFPPDVIGSATARRRTSLSRRLRSSVIGSSAFRSTACTTWTSADGRDRD